MLTNATVPGSTSARGERKLDKWTSADEAANLIDDGDTVALVGGGGGLLEAAELFAAIEARFMRTGSPNRLTITHALGIGDRNTLGINRFAHAGMVKRVVGGHWVWSPTMQELARTEQVEAYALPAGVMMQLMREIGAGRPGLFSKIGLGTYVDPRHGGGRMNESATQDLVELVEIDGAEWLRYKPFPVNVAVLRGSRADAHGNVSIDSEAATLDLFAVALACRNSGGRVVVQVRDRVEVGEIPAHRVAIPAAFVDALVHAPNQVMAHTIGFDPACSGEERSVPGLVTPLEAGARRVIAVRAAQELADGAVINFGFGFPDAVASLLAERASLQRYYQTIEHGTHGGELLTGNVFGFARNPSAMIDGPSQFDWYNGGGLDTAFLGFGEVDRFGNVNASKLGGVAVGPGGFIDISQSARTVVFCGTFDAKGTQVSVTQDGIRIDRYGDVAKFVPDVDQVTFSGRNAVAAGQRVLYVTERAVFQLGQHGLVLIEIAPGVDVQRDIIERIAFEITVAEPIRIMEVSDALSRANDAPHE
jgi:propionate CoA-transferase